MTRTFVIACALVAVGCTSSPSRPPASSTRHSVAANGLDATYSTGPIRFRYPSVWTAQKIEGLISTFATPMVALSNQPLDSCRTSDAITVCHEIPVDSLEPGGVVL